MLVIPFGVWMQVTNEKALFQRTYIKWDKGVFPILKYKKKKRLESLSSLTEAMEK